MTGLVHIRNKDLQTSTFTGSAAFTMESGVAVEMESGTALELDGTVSWTIQIIHAKPNFGVIHIKNGEQFETTVGLQYSLVNQSGDALVNQSGDALVANISGSWPTPLVHV